MCVCVCVCVCVCARVCACVCARARVIFAITPRFIKQICIAITYGPAHTSTYPHTHEAHNKLYI